MFSKLDASSRFWQLQLDDESSRLCTFNSPFGRFRFKRLPFGISSAPEIFHRTIHNLFEHTEGVDTSMDDIIVWGNDQEDHDRHLRNVLEKAREVGLKLQKDKCEFSVLELTFLGETISKDGLKPDERKFDAITNMETPTCKKELQRFLGMINFLARFLPDLSTRTAVLRNLLDKNNAWEWTAEHDQVFKGLKDIVSSKPVLQFYDSSKPTKIAADASQRGLGAVLLQLHEQGWLPVAYASRAITETESRYASIEKESLALTFACERFHQYVYGQRFEAETDHKPLIAIFSKALNDCPPRIQRFRLRLQKYDFHLVHVPGKYMYTADTLSRAPLQASSSSMEEEIESYVNCVMSSISVTDYKQRELSEATAQDRVLELLVDTIFTGWPEERSQCPVELRPYWNFRDELSVINGLVLKGTRVVVPSKLRNEMLKKIHAGHLGMEKCKKRAREVLFWPNMNRDVENLVKTCEPCQKHQKQHTAEPLLSHKLPSEPWQKVSTDLFELDRKHYIVIVDAYSNYPEVIALPSQSSESVIRVMKTTFARYGIPEEVLSGNGPCYSSVEFKQFSKDWNFNHVTSSPGYPKSNGLAERTVQTVKSIFKKCLESHDDPHLGLLAYRTTPLDNGLSPAQLLMGRQLRTDLPISKIRPKTRKFARVMRWRENQRNRQKYYHDRNRGGNPLSSLDRGDKVRLRKTTRGARKDIS